MTNKELYDLTKYLFESWERGADYDNYHMDCQYVLEGLVKPEQEPVARVLALEDALKEIAYAGMSPPFDMTDDSKTAWHARQAWNFIGIASRGLAQQTEDTK